MNSLFTSFLDRLVGRLATLVAGIVSSRVEGLQAAVQADQQSQLEDLARRYEADGKTEIAAQLRQRSLKLTSVDLASDAVKIVDRLTSDDEPEPSADPALAPSGPRALADFRVPGRATGRRRKKAGADGASDDAGDSQ